MQAIGIARWNPPSLRGRGKRRVSAKGEARALPFPRLKAGDWLEPGLRQVDGLRSADVERLVAAGRIASVEELRRRGGVPVHAIQRLAAADAFRSMGLDRRAALWDSRALKQAPDLPLFAHAEARDEGSEAEPAQLPGDAARRACRE